MHRPSILRTHTCGAHVSSRREHQTWTITHHTKRWTFHMDISAKCHYSRIGKVPDRVSPYVLTRTLSKRCHPSQNCKSQYFLPVSHHGVEAVYHLEIYNKLIMFQSTYNCPTLYLLCEILPCAYLSSTSTFRHIKKWSSSESWQLRISNDRGVC